MESIIPALSVCENTTDSYVLLGSREVEGFNGYQGTGFRVEGTTEFVAEGPIFDEMFEAFPFIKRVLIVKAESTKQLL